MESNPPINVLLAVSRRALQNKSSAADLTKTFHEFESRVTTSDTLNEGERRKLADLPDADDEALNIKKKTKLTRDELLSKGTYDPANLTEDEMMLLLARFWPEITSFEELMQMEAAEFELRSLADATEAQADIFASTKARLDFVREKTLTTSELHAFKNAEDEFARRQEDEKESQERAHAEKALFSAPLWVRLLYKRKDLMKSWGYVCFVGESLHSNDTKWEEICSKMDSALWWARSSTKSSEIATPEWKLQMVQTTSFSSSIPSEDESKVVADLRDAFQQARAQQPPSELGDFGIIPGLLTSTFLVIDQRCVDSILSKGGIVDDMEILAVEPDFPKPNYQYAEGYPGYMRVRLQQICCNFFEMRWLHDQNVGMDRLWAVAQKSRGKVFVSPDESQGRLFSTKKDVGSALTRDGAFDAPYSA